MNSPFSFELNFDVGNKITAKCESELRTKLFYSLFSINLLFIAATEICPS